MPSVLARPDYHSAPDYASTLGPEVGELGALVGFAPHPEQQMLLDDTFAEDARGKPSAFEVAAVVARQNMKTGWMKLAALGWLFLTDQRLVIWSAHEFPTAREAFRDMIELIDGSDMLSKRTRKVYSGAGTESIETVAGQRLIFKARTSGGGRGLSGDKVILDEAFGLQPEHMGALLPTMLARPHGQVLYGSSAGMKKSAILRALRERGRAGSGDRLAYSEWCADVLPCELEGCQHRNGARGCALDDRGLWAQANPVLCRADPSMEGVASLREALPPAEFMRECLGWWDDPPLAGEGVFGPAWLDRRVDDAEPDPACLGVAVSVDRMWASIGAVGRHGDDWLLAAVDRRRGTAWAVEETARICLARGLSVAVDASGPAGSLVQPLKDAGVDVLEARLSDYLDACDKVADGVASGGTLHAGHDELDAAVAVAQWRDVGDRRAFGRKTSTGDISMLEAVTMARWGAERGAAVSVYESRGLVSV